MMRSARLWGAGTLLVLIMACIVFGRLPPWTGGLYLIAGMTVFVLYRADKRAAERGDWRISERMLHTIDLAFGIIGGLLAQQIYRHKTSKPGFRAITWAIAALHGLALALVLCGVVTPETIWALLERLGR